ncbi:hypothetical protein MTR_5g082740 [Medicago truncatula]|uniref:Uncharacterized protein n=1 Tax=Medicago truncatula TaxID=3880 RepID=G7K243_MEDTR|nr:hypothetical protein MTR_5g082740 [Medicago truncatula]
MNLSGALFWWNHFDRFGRCHTAAELPASGNPHKPTVLIYATVQKIVFDTTERSITFFCFCDINLMKYCEEEENFTRMLLVFEYAPNGILFEHFTR